MRDLLLTMAAPDNESNNDNSSSMSSSIKPRYGKFIGSTFNKFHYFDSATATTIVNGGEKDEGTHASDGNPVNVIQGQTRQGDKVNDEKEDGNKMNATDVEM
jgi:hypothetical protein